jgi:hypothetical protein
MQVLPEVFLVRKDMQVGIYILYAFIAFIAYFTFALVGSDPITFKGISLTVWTQFKQLFDQIRDEKGDLNSKKKLP